MWLGMYGLILWCRLSPERQILRLEDAVLTLVCICAVIKVHSQDAHASLLPVICAVFK